MPVTNQSSTIITVTNQTPKINAHLLEHKPQVFYKVTKRQITHASKFRTRRNFTKLAHILYNIHGRHFAARPR